MVKMELSSSIPIMLLDEATSFFDSMISDGDKTPKVLVHLPRPTSAAQNIAVISGDLRVYLFGYVFYEDVIFSQFFTRYFMYVYDPSIDRFIQVKNPKYNREARDEPPYDARFHVPIPS